MSGIQDYKPTIQGWCVKNQMKLRKMMHKGNGLSNEPLTLQDVADITELSEHTIQAHLKPCGTTSHRHLRKERVELVKRYMVDNAW